MTICHVIYTYIEYFGGNKLQILRLNVNATCNTRMVLECH